MRNHNNLLGKVAGVDGLKTGFTNGAGFCLSATAQRDGRRVLVVMMGSPTSKIRDLKVSELLERGFAAIPASAAPLASPADSPIRAAPATKSAPAPATSDQPAVKFSIPRK
jgi:D-alanyl-D-alanine carboxypeptidase (penicillin-binding protein 5/6)